jgi:hypothetical protein
MRIGPPSITHQQNRHILSADIAIKTSGRKCPESMWFATEGEESFFLPDMSDAFVVGLIASVMYLGEDIWVEGMVSTRLAHGLETYQNVLNTWWPDIFKCVDIHYESLVERRQDLRPRGVGCTFSGGLDSYHAVMQLLPSNVKYSGFSITHALMINGFDQLYDPKRQDSARKMISIYQPILEEWGVNLLMIDSNMKSFRTAMLKRRDQVHSYCSALAACAHALGGVFGRFGISGHATYAYNQLEPDGSHPALDHLLSSDQLQIIHTGTSHSRSKKTEILAEISNVQKSLRVCFGALNFDQQTGMPVNCCECEKCIRTMVAMIIIGKLDKFPTFSNRRFPLRAYRNPNNLRAIDDHHLKDMSDLAGRHGKNDWVVILDAAREKRRVMERKKQEEN